MKKIFSVFAAIIFTANVFAQMSYQAVLRDANNNLLKNQSVGMRVSILVQSGPTPHVLYQETYSPNPKTNANGLVTLEIGGGTPIIGTFSGINWSAGGNYSVQTEIDPTGGTNYTIKGSSALLYVPFAIRARKADSVNYSNIIGMPAPTHGSQYFDSSGTFTVPAGITTVWITASGSGGGGGGGGSYSGMPGGNGGAGGSGKCVIGYQISVTPGNSYPITVCVGGVGGSHDKAGGDGGSSSFGSSLTVIGGGGGGGGSIAYSNGGAGKGNASPLFVRGAGGNGGAGGNSGNGSTGVAGTSGFVLVAW